MNLQSALKVTMYLFTTVLIGISTQLGEMNYNLDGVTHNQWIGICVKALLPGLIAVRALFDTPPSKSINRLVGKTSSKSSNNQIEK